MAVGDLGVALFSGDGGVKSVGVNVGTWNSLHTGDAGLDNGMNGKLWYESDFYATVGFGFGRGTSVGVTYTAYTSPNGLFSTVQGAGVQVCRGRQRLISGGWRRQAVHARGASSWSGQADGGTEEGTYLELGDRAGLCRLAASAWRFR